MQGPLGKMGKGSLGKDSGGVDAVQMFFESLQPLDSLRQVQVPSGHKPDVSALLSQTLADLGRSDLARDVRPCPPGYLQRHWLGLAEAGRPAAHGEANAQLSAGGAGRGARMTT